MKIKLVLVAIASLLIISVAHAECPQGTWPRNQYSGPGGGNYSGPGGGLYTGPGGGAYTGPGGGMYTGPGGGLYTGPGGGLYSGPDGGMYGGPSQYFANIPPWHVFVKYLEEHGKKAEADSIKSAMP